MNKRAYLLTITAVLHLVACAGGTMGTGVRKYSPTGEVEASESRSLFDFESHTARCAIRSPSGTTYEIYLSPVVREVNAVPIDPLTCDTSFILSSHTTKVLLTENIGWGRRKPLSASVELQSALPADPQRWSTELTLNTTPNSEAKSMEAHFSSSFIRHSKRFRLVIKVLNGPTLFYQFALTDN